MHQEEKCIIIRDQISRVASSAYIQAKFFGIRTCLKINFPLQDFDIFRQRLHETRTKLKPVLDLKPLWKVIPFTWQFHCGHATLKVH